MFICPICKNPLTLGDKEALCSNKHNFSRARQGYYHLLPANKKSSKQPGDSKEMIKARGDFLGSGAYQPLAQAIVERAPQTTGALLDLGCGEGYFSRYLRSNRQISNLVGIDISKESIRQAASQDKTATYLVASNFALPLSAQAIDVAVINFAPVDSKELQRVLKPQAKVLRIVPTEQHLHHLKRLIYRTLRRPPSTDLTLDGFELTNERQLEFTSQLSQLQKCNLMQMTPLLWKLTPEVKDRYLSSTQPETFSFTLAEYQLA